MFRRSHISFAILVVLLVSSLAGLALTLAGTPVWGLSPKLTKTAAAIQRLTSSPTSTTAVTIQKPTSSPTSTTAVTIQKPTSSPTSTLLQATQIQTMARAVSKRHTTPTHAPKAANAAQLTPSPIPSSPSLVSRTVTVATDGSGNFTDINQAVTALGSAGGTILVKDGTYPPARLTSNISLEGEGTNALIRTPAGSTANALNILNAQNVHVLHIRVVGNWNGAPRANFTGRSYIDGNGIRVYASQAVYLDNDYATNAWYGGITIDTSTNVTITNNLVEKNGSNNIFLRPNNSHIDIAYNTSRNAAYSGIQCLRSDYVTIVHNTSYNNGPSQAQGDGAGSEGCRYTTIASNILYGNNPQGVKVDYTVEGGGTAQRSLQVSVTNNTIYNQTISDNAGIFVDRADQTYVSGNNIYNNYYGVNIGPVGPTTITGNKISGSLAVAIRAYDASAVGPIDVTNNILCNNARDIVNKGVVAFTTSNNSCAPYLTPSVSPPAMSPTPTLPQVAQLPTMTPTGSEASATPTYTPTAVSPTPTLLQVTELPTMTPTGSEASATPTYTPTVVLTPEPTPLPSPMSGSLPNFIASVDTMIDSKNTSAPQNQLTDAQIANDVNLSASMHTTHITVDTFMDYPDYMRRWVNAVRATGKHVWFRLHFNAWSGNNGVAANMTASQYLAALDAFIKANPTMFQPGDIADFCSEAENGKYWVNTYGKGWASTNAPNAATDDFNYFQVAIMDIADADLHAAGIYGVITTIRSTNSWWPLHPKSYYPSTIARMGMVAIDTYPDSSITDPTLAAQARVNEMLRVWNVVHVPVIVGEMGYDIKNAVDDQTQASVISAELSAMAQLPFWKGVNYWVGAGFTSNTSRLFNGTRASWYLRPAGVVVSNFYALH